MQRERPRGKAFFFGLFALLAYATFVLIKPFLSIIMLALISVLMLKPLYDFFMRRRWVKGRRRIATTLTVLVFILLLVIPVVLLASLALSQATAFFEYLGSDQAWLSLQEMLADVESYVQELPGLREIEFDQEAFAAKVAELAKGAVNWLVNLAKSLGATIPQLMVYTIIFLALLVTLLPAYDDLNQRLQQLSPLDVDISRRYIRKAQAMITSIVTGIFLLAIIQGLIMGFFFWLARIPFTWFLTILSIAFAVIPALGISFIVLPLAIIMLLSGQTSQALLVLFGFYVVVNPLDFILRPRLVSKEAYFNFALMLLAIFGGLQLAGLLGIVYGPLVMILFLTTIEIYEEHYAQVKAPSDPESLEADDTDVDVGSQAESPA